MKNYVLAGVAVVVTVLGVSFVGKPNVNVTTPAPVVNVSVPEQKTPVVNVQAPDVKVPATVVNVPETKLGAVSGPDTYFPYVGNNDLRKYSTRKALITSTTTPCSIKTPTATSTLSHASLKILTASSTATVWTLAKASSAYATTTKLGAFSVASGAFGTLVATTTYTTVGPTADDKFVLGPNNYLVWGMQGIGTSYDSTKFTGICQAEFIEI